MTTSATPQTHRAGPMGTQREPITLRTTSWLQDVRSIFGREIRPLIHDPFQVVFAMVQPLFFLALFAPLLPEAITGDSRSALQWFVPGIVAVVTPFSFDLHPLGVLVGVVILAVFAVGISSLSYALALACAGRDWMFWTVQQTLLFPVLLLAGVLLPVDDAPTWIRVLSALNPLTYVVDAERALFAGIWQADEIAAGAAAALGVAVVGLIVGVRSMQRNS